MTSTGVFRWLVLVVVKISSLKLLFFDNPDSNPVLSLEFVVERIYTRRTLPYPEHALLYRFKVEASNLETRGQNNHNLETRGQTPQSPSLCSSLYHLVGNTLFAFSVCTIRCQSILWHETLLFSAKALNLSIFLSQHCTESVNMSIELCHL